MKPETASSPQPDLPLLLGVNSQRLQRCLRGSAVGLESGRGVTAGLVALTIYRVLLARGSATPSVAVCVWCDRAEKSSLISQRLPLPLSRSPPSRLPSLLALSRSLLCLSRGVSVPECSQSSSGNLDPESVCTRSRTHARTHTRTHALRFSPRGHRANPELHLPEGDGPAGHFLLTCHLRRSEQRRN